MVPGTILSELTGGMAGIEFSVFSRNYLRKRVPDEDFLGREADVLALERNRAQVHITWRLGILEARTKVHRLNPVNS